MDEELDYLWETLGLEITADLWPERDKIHPRYALPLLWRRQNTAVHPF